ncbi:phytanoyl-CoA dioxygenase family protein [Candidatus Pelagibacter sp.]|nr:phytanoyl-CoA dioxygenase family protein [Candidatus Pelagibacter sp.]
MNNYNELKKLYIDRGWVVCKKLFSQDEISSINLIINNFLEKKLIKINKKSRTINFTNNSTKNVDNINSFHKLAQCTEIKNLANKRSILDVAKKFLDSNPEFRGCELFAKPAKNGLPSPDHQDNYYWAVKGSNALTLWIALEKSNRDNGCVHYYDGSHKYGILNHEDSFAKGSSQKISDTNFLRKFNISYPELEPGDVIVHHSLVVHGSSKNISKKSRKGWTIQFKDKNASYDLDHIKAYEKSLNNQIQLR